MMGIHKADHGIPTSHGDFTPHEPYEVDAHGFIYEGDTKNLRPSADADAGNPSVKELYRSFGGGHDASVQVRRHWESKPLMSIRTDTPVHTAQAATTTEFKQTDQKQVGRDRINSIRNSLESGEPMREPVWLVRQSGRLYAMDGHHRVVAAREAGLGYYPARVWDRDKEGVPSGRVVPW